jgi:hypothetical protein
MSQVSVAYGNEQMGSRASNGTRLIDSTAARLANLIAVLQRRRIDAEGRATPHGKRSFRADERDAIAAEWSERRTASAAV